MKKFICAVLTLLMLFGVCACQKSPTANETTTAAAFKPEDLYFTWETTDFFSEENAQAILKSMGFTDAEIAFADLTKLGAVKTMTFNADGTYSFGYDKDDTVAMLTTYYTDYISKIFEHKAELTAVYGDEVMSCTSFEQFKEFFAFIYSVGSFEEAITKFISYTVMDELFATKLEEGAFTVENEVIALLKTGATEPELIAFKLENEVLSVAYTDSGEIYYKK